MGIRGDEAPELGGEAVLSGPVRDKDDLEKLLQRLHDRGLRLVSVRSPAWQVGVTRAEQSRA